MKIDVLTLFPEMVQIPAASVELFNKIIPEIERIGFEISNLGGGSYALQFGSCRLARLGYGGSYSRYAQQCKRTRSELAS